VRALDRSAAAIGALRIGQEGDRAGLIILFADIWMMVEDAVNLPVIVTV
jgi:hypothetical protein